MYLQVTLQNRDLHIQLKMYLLQKLSIKTQLTRKNSRKYKEKQWIVMDPT